MGRCVFFMGRRVFCGVVWVKYKFIVGVGFGSFWGSFIGFLEFFDDFSCSFFDYRYFFYGWFFVRSFLV